MFDVVDLELSQRLEQTEGAANAEFVDCRRRLQPETKADWIRVAGTYAMFDGVHSPLTQTFGLGIFEQATDGVLDQLEAFFHERHAPVFHEVSPLVSPEILPRLAGRGYRPIELTSVMYLPLLGREARTINPNIHVRVIEEPEVDQWVRLSIEGWEAHGQFAELMKDFAEIGARRRLDLTFVAEFEGTPVATASMFTSGRTALLAGASTLPPWRRRGAQGALVEHRLRVAAAMGCDLAMMCALPGGSSQKNGQRQGFRIAYTRIKWQLGDAGGLSDD